MTFVCLVIGIGFLKFYLGVACLCWVSLDISQCILKGLKLIFYTVWLFVYENDGNLVIYK